MVGGTQQNWGAAVAALGGEGGRADTYFLCRSWAFERVRATGSRYCLFIWVGLTRRSVIVPFTHFVSKNKN